jgi:hypothetical protein
MSTEARPKKSEYVLLVRLDPDSVDVKRVLEDLALLVDTHFAEHGGIVFVDPALDGARALIELSFLVESSDTAFEEMLSLFGGDAFARFAHREGVLEIVDSEGRRVHPERFLLH